MWQCELNFKIALFDSDQEILFNIYIILTKLTTTDQAVSSFTTSTLKRLKSQNLILNFRDTYTYKCIIHFFVFLLQKVYVKLHSNLHIYS